MHFANNKWFLLVLPFLITGCFTANPALEEETTCELTTREWELEVHGNEGANFAGLMANLSVACGEPECALYGLLGIVAIPVTSFIVSGSIVVVGNTVHWLEEQGTCEESMTRAAIGTLVESTESAGGMMIQTGNEFVRWVKQHAGSNSEE